MRKKSRNKICCTADNINTSKSIEMQKISDLEFHFKISMRIIHASWVFAFKCLNIFDEAGTDCSSEVRSKCYLLK